MTEDDAAFVILLVRIARESTTIRSILESRIGEYAGSKLQDLDEAEIYDRLLGQTYGGV